MATIEARLRGLPPLFHVSTHAPLLCEAFGGIGRSTLYRALADGSLGVRPIRIGGKEKPRLFLRRADVLEVLGVPGVAPGWQLPQHGTRQRDIGELLLASPAPVVAGGGQGEPSQSRCGAPAEQAAQRWAEVLR
jgi:hypothetical protein